MNYLKELKVHLIFMTLLYKINYYILIQRLYVRSFSEIKERYSLVSNENYNITEK